MYLGPACGLHRACEGAIAATSSPLLVSDAACSLWQREGLHCRLGGLRIRYPRLPCCSHAQLHTVGAQVGIEQATGIVYNITGPEDMTLHEVGVAGV